MDVEEISKSQRTKIEVKREGTLENIIYGAFTVLVAIFCALTTPKILSFIDSFYGFDTGEHSKIHSIVNTGISFAFNLMAMYIIAKHMYIIAKQLRVSLTFRKK